MLGLFKKKKKGVKSDGDDSVPLPPAPPAPSKSLNDEVLSHVPDNHPLDRPLAHRPLSNPGTNLAEDDDLEEIQRAINRVGEDHSPKDDDLEMPEAPESEDKEQTEFPFETDEEKDDDFMEGDFVVPDLPEKMKEFPDTPEDDEEPALEEQDEKPVQMEEKEDDVQQEEEQPIEGLMDEDQGDDLPRFDQGKPDIERGYDLENLPDPEKMTAPRAEFGIYVDLRDYEKIFKEIRFIDSFSKRCFRTVLKLKDISGNQNKLIDKFHADLAYVNERLTYMDSTFFERRR